jgi:hypothetical protein
MAAVAIFLGSFGLCDSTLAIEITPNETVLINCCETVGVTYSGTGPITDVTFNFIWSDSDPWLQGTTVFIEAFDAGGNALGSDFLTQPFPNIPSSFGNGLSTGLAITPTSDLSPYLLVTSVDATFDFTGALIIPDGPNYRPGFIGGESFAYTEPVAAPFNPFPPYPPPIPIPSTIPLFATGLGALGLFGWRRKRTQKLYPFVEPC